MSEAPLVLTKKQAELLQSSDISKYWGKQRKNGAAYAAPLDLNLLY